ncbi:MAG: GAF domain-containing protein, partial [Chitinophagaceae bacterium]|nr:GAF domain-containing protein [Rubrivivax sp.]
MNVRENSTLPVAIAPVAEPDRPPPRGATPGLEGLLAAVVGACHCLVQHSDLKTGLKAAVAQLGQLSGHDRAYVWELVDNRQVCELVAEWDAPGVGCVSEMAGTRLFAVADYLEVWQPLLAGRAYQSITPFKSGANARFNELVANRSDVMVPIFVGDICWGCIGFDNCREERRYSDPEIQVLRGAAAAVAAAVQRSRAEAQVHAEAQRQRQLLAAVNEASAHLVVQADLDTALSWAVESLSVHTCVDRVFINRYAPEEQSTYFWLESHRPGVPAFTDGFGPGPWPDDQFAEVAYPLREGRIYRSVSWQRGGANAAANTANGSRSDLIVPIMVDGQYRACIGFDDNTHARAWSDSEVAVLQTAAHAVAGALARHAADAAR